MRLTAASGSDQLKNIESANRLSILSNGQNRPANDQAHCAIAIPKRAIAKNTRPYLPCFTSRMLSVLNCSV